MNVKDFKTKVCGYLSNILLPLAFGLNLYTKWINSQPVTIFIIILCGLFAVSLCALKYLVIMETMRKRVLHLWLGVFLGIIIFKESPEYKYKTSVDIMNFLLVFSTLLRWLQSFCARLQQLKKHEVQLFSFSEVFESVGMFIASLCIGTVESFSIALFVLSFIINLTAIRLKAMLGLLTMLVLIVAVVLMILPGMYIQVNIWGVMCFTGRHLFDPIVDLYFSRFSTLERWQTFFSKTGRSIASRFVVIVIGMVNVVSVALIGYTLAIHEKWYVVIFFIPFAPFWLFFHFIYLISTWKLMNKITECCSILHGMIDNHNSMNQVMASKGIRHFSLMSGQPISCTLFTTFILIVFILMTFGRVTETYESIGLVMLIFPIEAMTLSVFWELGSNLGGTCTGYALITPYTGRQSGSGAKLHSTSDVKYIGSQATATLNKIQQFFNVNMIHNFGCDFWSSGIEKDHIKSKITQFFECSTADGPRYDTYLLYYSGDSHVSGDWVLTGHVQPLVISITLSLHLFLFVAASLASCKDRPVMSCRSSNHLLLSLPLPDLLSPNMGIKGQGNESLKLSILLQWWTQKNRESGSRLILVCDTPHSWSWAKEVAEILDDFVALQTFKDTCLPDLEVGEKLTVGAFTNDWVDFNLNGEIDPEWSDKDRVMQAIYKVSDSWTDFSFHLPTLEDFEHHWNINFAIFPKPFGECVYSQDTASPCCDGVRKYFKRKWMQLKPPKVYDTGHGFKLVSS